MAEEYISFEEAAKLTGKTEDDLKAFVQEKGLRQFRDAGATKFRRAEFLEAAGIQEEVVELAPEAEGEDDFLIFADEEESKSDTVSDTLDLAEDMEAEKSTADSAELTAAETVEGAGEELAAEEFDFGEEDIFADESTTDFPAAEAEADSSGALEELEMLEEEDSSGGEGSSGLGSGEEDTSHALGELESGSGVTLEEEEEIAEPMTLGEVAEAEEEAAPAPRARSRARRPMRMAPAEEGAGVWGILCVIAAGLVLFVGLLIVNELIGRQSYDGDLIHGIDRVQGWLKPIQKFFWEKGGHY